MPASRRLSNSLAQAAQRSAVQPAGKHLPGTPQQVMRLIHQQGHVAPAVKNALNVHRRIKGIVIVADHHVRQLRQRQGKLKGAQQVLVRHGPHGVPGPVLRMQHFQQRLLVTEEMPPGPWAPVGMTNCRMRALPLLRVQGKHPQVHALGTHAFHSLQGALALGGAGREVIDLPRQPFPQGL